VTVRPELWMNEVSSTTVVDSILSATPAPGAAPVAAASAFTRP
jgi:MoxR-like ATPase